METVSRSGSKRCLSARQAERSESMEHEYSDFHIDELMSILKHGEQNATSRKTLCTMMDMPDRKVRLIIEKARDEGCLILNKQDGKGYYLPENIEDIRKQYVQDKNRAMSILKRQKHMRRILKEANIAV